MDKRRRMCKDCAFAEETVAEDIVLCSKRTRFMVYGWWCALYRDREDKERDKERWGICK